MSQGKNRRRVGFIRDLITQRVQCIPNLFSEEEHAFMIADLLFWIWRSVPNVVEMRQVRSVFLESFKENSFEIMNEVEKRITINDVFSYKKMLKGALDVDNWRNKPINFHVFLSWLRIPLQKNEKANKQKLHSWLVQFSDEGKAQTFKNKGTTRDDINQHLKPYASVVYRDRMFKDIDVIQAIIEDVTKPDAINRKNF